MRITEHYVQVALADYLRTVYPAVMFRSDAGGVRLNMGQAVALKRIQAGRAWPDIFIAEPMGGYHGLFIEIKTGNDSVYRKDGMMRKNKHINEQAQILSHLCQRGYLAVFGLGFEDCRYHVDQYLRGTNG